MLVSFAFIWVFLSPALSVLTEASQEGFGKKPTWTPTSNSVGCCCPHLLLL